MCDAPTYDAIGGGYALRRRSDPRWAAQIHHAIRDHQTLVNVGAGAGSYEPEFLTVVAVEPSFTMIDQRPPSAAPVVCAAAERLPFADNTFDVALSVLSVHHWNSASSGLAEMRRVAQNQVIVTWDPIVFAREFWLVRDYLPEVIEHESRLATLASVAGHLGKHEVKALPVSADCADGVFGAYWRRPHAYLDPAIRAAISGLALLDPELVRDAMERLRTDLESGCWYHRYSELTEMNEVDLGYRLVIAEE